MNIASLLSLALDPGRFFLALGRIPDAWQTDVLFSTERQLLLNCSRQAGKSTVVAALALHTALFTPGGALVLVVAPALRQSEELYRKIVQLFQALGRPVGLRGISQQRLELANGSRVVCLPGREATIRAYSGVRLLLLDEAARVPDALYRSVRPMLAVSAGRLVALSTPFGCRGWFHREWTGTGPWRRFHIPWTQCPRIAPEFVAEERRALGDDWVRQEYEGDFLALVGRVYPDWELALVAEAVTPTGRLVGGIDFGWRSPFAAVWGVVDRDDVLWILGEHYRTETPLHEHASVLARVGAVMWYADPAGRTEREELLAHGLTVRAARNAIRAGIAAVTARLRTGRLKILESACPNLLREGQLYRYPEGERTGTEEPVDRHNHAMDALRYLVSRLDVQRGTTTEPIEEPRDERELWQTWG
jgi:hypothetical protein